MDDVQLTFRGLDRTPALETYIRQRVERLLKRCQDLTACSVAIERRHRPEASGNPYRVRINCELPPGHDIVVVKDEGDHALGDSLRVVINNAFKAAERQVQHTSQLRRRDVKHQDLSLAIVSNKFDDRGYGFLRTLDGREIFFHENAVAHGAFDELTVGTEVRFEESLGNQGPQASSLQIVGKPSGKV